ncbi:SH3 domain-containing protein [Leptospira kanakyensis]|uniref:hypothetical protein n=1 Tax=Leptospira kanakyensis TaxID=2484968 RepID=UPI00223D38E0|nr:hypothetical protein [Leptospira kanakyensis]MCW7483271.1 hypothetical protein [Leptospira kanakyensis]
MIKKTTIYILITLYLSTCVSIQKTNEKLPNIEEIIKNENFSDSSGIHYLSLKFLPKSRFSFSYSSEGWDWETSGSFSIKENSIYLLGESCSSSIEEQKKKCSNSFNDGICSITEDKLNLEYQYELVCYSKKPYKIYTSFSDESNEISFNIKKYILPIGSIRKYNDVEIYTLQNKIGISKENVSLREGPGVDFPKTDYVVNVYDGPRFVSLPKGKKVTIHGRTLQKQSVKSWENYWLLISIDDTRMVWAFAEFFDY